MLLFIYHKISYISKIRTFILLFLSTIVIISTVLIITTLRTLLLHKVPVKGGTLSIRLKTPLAIPLPYQEQTIADSFFTKLVFAGAGIVRDHELYFDLAENISTDELSTKITPKEQITFSNGAPITIDDIIFSLNEFFRHSGQSKNPPLIDEDGGSIVIHNMTSENILFEGMIEAPWINKEIFTKYPPLERISKLSEILDYSSGPYRVSRNFSFTRTYIFARKNYDGPHYLSTISFESDPQLSDISRKQDITIVESQNILDITLPKKIEPRYSSSKNIIGVFMGNKFSSSFTDLKNIITHTHINSTLLGAKQYSPLYFGNNTIFEIPKKTKSSGTLELSYPDNNYYKTLAVAIQDQAKKYNYNIILKPVKSYTLKNLIQDRNFSTLLYGYEIEQPSDTPLFFKSTSMYPQGLNIFNIKSTEIDTLLNEPLTKQSVAHLEEKILQQKTFIPLISPHFLLFAQNSVYGIVSYDKNRSTDLFEEPRFWYKSQKFTW